MRTEINTYGKLTVEIIEEFINQEIAGCRNALSNDLDRIESDKITCPDGGSAFHIHLLHESMVRLEQMVNFKRGLENHDLNIRCRDGE
tara:strand:- start:252 stop:515 length:264 start_codon:yes stop_codon:yes gene_type:complete